ncbi:hypothetical protein [Zavarzinella formosa]|uniref:hypothetical protein n=1 Tax=Zavarzinella formosa TaxID=360055 RepID=UPI0002DE2318|nr:hypothetical protein [Zavarzinella formosa]
MNPSSTERQDKLPPLLVMLFLWFRTHAAPLELILRKPGTAGRAYFSWASFFSVFWVAVFAACVAVNDRQMHAMCVFWIAFMVMAFVHAIAGARARKRGYACHSGYMGDSWIGVIWPWLLRRKGGWWIKSCVEPVLMFFGSIPVFLLCPPLGLYMLVGAFALLGITGYIEERDKRMAEAMNDAVIEQRHLHDLYRRNQ